MGREQDRELELEREQESEQDSVNRVVINGHEATCTVHAT